MEVQGQGVLEKTSEEGQVYILRDMKRLRESWLALYNMSLNLHRLLNSSKEQTESDLRRVGGLTVGSTSITTEPSLGEGDSQVRTGSSRSQRHQQQDKTAEASSEPAGGGPLEGEAGDGAMTGQGGWIQGYGEDHLILPRQDNEYFSSSMTGKDSGRSFKGDEVDSSAWSIHSRSGQKVPKDTTTDRSPDSDTSRRRRRDPAKQPSATPTQHTMGGTEQKTSRRREFEAWLSKQNDLLSRILSTKGATLRAKELKIRQDTLKPLVEGVSWGQEQFQLLLQESQGSEAGSGPAEDVCLEELRYRWMLYKSKLKDVGDVRARTSAKVRGKLTIGHIL